MYEQLPGGRVTHRFEPVVLVLALLVIPVVLLETAGSDGAAREAAYVLNWIIWIGFAAELAFVLAVAPRKRAALRAHGLDAFIVVVTVPLLPTLLSSFRLARLLRLLRLLRLAALGTRAVVALRVLTTGQVFRYLGLITVLLVVVAAGAVTAADHEHFPNVWIALWWAVVTVTTVGYGDVYPHTVAGRIVAAVLMFVGIGFLSALTATIAATFVRRDESTGSPAQDVEILQALERIEQRLAQIERQG